MMIQSTSVNRVFYKSNVQFLQHTVFSKSNYEHCEINQKFCEVAETNDIDCWQKEGIPPVFCSRVKPNGEFFIITSYGCTRLNSVRAASRACSKVLSIPLFELPQEWIVNIDISKGESQPRFLLNHMFDEIAWSLYPYSPPPSKDMIENDFHGFS